MKKMMLTAVAVLLVAAGCAKSVPQQQSQTSEPTPTAMVQTSQGTFKSLMAMGSPQKCEINYSQGNNISQGTVFVIPGGKMRGDFTAQVQGKMMLTHMIADGQNVYTWIDGMSMGFKMQQTQNQPTPTAMGGAGANQNNVNMDQKVTYNCQSWAVDNSVFTPPSNITFQDESQMMHMTVPTKSGAMTPSTSQPDKAAMCAMCNNAGAGKAQCLAAMGCK
jgi:hypothetical protein